MKYIIPFSAFLATIILSLFSEFFVSPSLGGHTGLLARMIIEQRLDPHRLQEGRVIIYTKGGEGLSGHGFSGNYIQLYLYRSPSGGVFFSHWIYQKNTFLKVYLDGTEVLDMQNLVHEHDLDNFYEMGEPSTIDNSLQNHLREHKTRYWHGIFLDFISIITLLVLFVASIFFNDKSKRVLRD